MRDRLDRRLLPAIALTAPFMRRYGRPMDATTRELLHRALTLPPTERAELASALIDSCEADVDPDAETAWLTEIAQRAARVRADGPVGIPWSTVRAELLAT